MKKEFPTLSLCKKLTEAGFPDTESVYMDNGYLINNAFIEHYHGEAFDFTKKEFVCPSISELLYELPNKIEFEVPLFLHMNKTEDGWIVQYICSYKHSSPTSIKIAGELPDILSEMYLILKKGNNI